MKKILSLILALTLVMSLSVTAFAVDEQRENIPVTATYQKDVANDKDPSIVISADIIWGNMSFQYYDGNQNNRNPDSHAYDGKSYWRPKDNNSHEISVTNHSNTIVRATFSFESTVHGITGKFIKKQAVLDPNANIDHVILRSADGIDSYWAAHGESVLLYLDGPLAQGQVDAKIGTAKVVVSPEVFQIPENN